MDFSLLVYRLLEWVVFSGNLSLNFTHSQWNALIRCFLKEKTDDNRSFCFGSPSSHFSTLLHDWVSLKKNKSGCALFPPTPSLEADGDPCVTSPGFLASCLSRPDCQVKSDLGGIGSRDFFTSSDFCLFFVFSLSFACFIVCLEEVYFCPISCRLK